MKIDRIVALAVAATALIGLGLTFLPLVTFEASSRLVLYSGSWERIFLGGDDSLTARWDELCREYQDSCPGGGVARLDVGMFDLIASSYTAIAVVPLALALCVAAGAVHAWRGDDRRVFAAVALVSLGALVVAVFTAIDPAVTVSGTGDFRNLTANGPVLDSGDLSMAVGPGLYLPGLLLLAILGVSGWRSFVRR